MCDAFKEHLAETKNYLPPGTRVRLGKARRGVDRVYWNDGTIRPFKGEGTTTGFYTIIEPDNYYGVLFLESYAAAREPIGYRRKSGVWFGVPSSIDRWLSKDGSALIGLPAGTDKRRILLEPNPEEQKALAGPAKQSVLVIEVPVDSPIAPDFVSVAYVSLQGKEPLRSVNSNVAGELTFRVEAR